MPSSSSRSLPGSGSPDFDADTSTLAPQQATALHITSGACSRRDAEPQQEVPDPEPFSVFDPSKTRDLRVCEPNPGYVYGDRHPWHSVANASTRI